jgi:hypothetical protein
MANKRSITDGQSGNPSNIRLNDVNPIWLEASATERYLLLEDTETGDILMPLIYMKHVLVANYSRKLAALKNRLVTIPVAGPLANQQGLLYWQWAFESPHAVKVIVRQEIGEATPQGHLRLVLIPIVYNALVAQEELRSSPLFHALHRAMRASTYWPLLLPIEDGLLPKLDAAAGITGSIPEFLFCGPRLLEATAIKYMFMFKDKEEMVASKRNRTTGASNIDNGVLTAAIMGSGLTQTTNLMALVPTAGGQQRPGADAASMEAAAAAAMASAAAMAAAAAAATAAAAANNDDEDEDNNDGGDDYDDEDGGMRRGGGGDESPQPSLYGGDAAVNTLDANNVSMPPPLQGNSNGLDMQAADINFHAQMVEAMMQQQLQLQQQQQQHHQLPPLPPGLLPQPQPQQQAMNQNTFQQNYPNQFHNSVPRNNSFGSLMRATGGGNNILNDNNIISAAPLIQHPGLQTSINARDIHTADAVRQLVDMKFQEVVRELMRLKSSMMQLYTAVVGVALQQGGGAPPELVGAGNYLIAGPDNNKNNTSNKFNGLLPGGGGNANNMFNGGAGHQGQQQQMQQQRMNNGGGVGVGGEVINQRNGWPPLYGEIQQAGVLNGQQQQHQQQVRINNGGTQPSQDELNLAALNKNNTTNTGGDLFPSLSGLLNESYPKDGKYLGSSLSFRDHPSLSLPDLGHELQQQGLGGGGGVLPASHHQQQQQQQQQQQGHGNGMNASPGAHQAAAWANAIGMSFPQQQQGGNNNNVGQH